MRKVESGSRNLSQEDRGLPKDNQLSFVGKNHVGRSGANEEFTKQRAL